jgi:hypothetical protein
LRFDRIERLESEARFLTWPWYKRYTLSATAVPLTVPEYFPLQVDRTATVFMNASTKSKGRYAETPVRESLKKLAAEGLVISRRRGWIVREHTGDEIREIYEMRSALESYCARLAALRGTDAEIQAIGAISRGADKTILKSRKVAELAFPLRGARGQLTDWRMVSAVGFENNSKRTFNSLAGPG